MERKASVLALGRPRVFLPDTAPALPLSRSPALAQPSGAHCGLTATPGGHPGALRTERGHQQPQCESSLLPGT